MTPQELKAICKQHGGQSAVARLLKITPRQMNNLYHGRSKITEQLASHIGLLYGEIK